MGDTAESIDLSNGWIVRVRCVDGESGVVHYDRRGGGAGWYRHPDAMDVEAGQVLFVPEDIDLRAPMRLSADHWPVQGAGIAVVARISDDGATVVFEVNGGYVSFPQRRESPFEEGQTVTLDASGRPGAVLSSRPIDRLGLRQARDELDPASLMVEPEELGVELDDFGGSEALVERATELVRVALDPEKRLDHLGVRPIKGILFSGPSGTGKTHLARALSRYAGANFYLIDGPEIINKWVGESEQRLRDLFTHAERHAPAILFFDELDSIVSRRGPEAPDYATRFVGQFLTMLDGFESYRRTLVIAATNLPEALDSALLRPGRLSFKLEFGRGPDADDRLAILKASARRVQGVEHADWPTLVSATGGWTAAELTMIWTEAGVLAAIDERNELCAEDIQEGLARATRNREISRRQEGPQ